MSASAAVKHPRDGGDDAAGAPTAQRPCLVEDMRLPPVPLPDDAGSAGAAEDAPPAIKHKGAKVTIVGAGQVGMACCYTMITRELCRRMVLIDIDAAKVEGEVMDLQHGAAFHRAMSVTGGTDYALAANSDLVVVTAGVRQRVGESRLSLVDRNVALFRHIIPPIVKHSPAAAICIVANPCDIMTSAAAHIAGLPPGRVFGSGTSLDSSRLRTEIARRMAVDPSSVHAHIVGEHGDSSVALWSQATVGSMRLADVNPRVGHADDPYGWDAIHADVVGAAGEVIARKGYTNWAIGLTVGAIARAVLHDEQRVMPVSTCVAGLHGVPADRGVYLSLPCVVGCGGVQAVLQTSMAADEAAAFRKSAEHVWAVQKDARFRDEEVAGGGGAGGGAGAGADGAKTSHK